MTPDKEREIELAAEARAGGRVVRRWPRWPADAQQEAARVLSQGDVRYQPRSVPEAALDWPIVRAGRWPGYTVEAQEYETRTRRGRL